MTALDRILSEHRSAVEEYLAAAGGVPEEVWTMERAQARWSPAQITEHLSISLEAVSRELSGGRPLQVVLPAWKSWWLRRRYLPPMLRSGRFPDGVKAPREIRPTGPSAPRAEALARLRAAAASIDRAYATDPKAARRRLHHPYFGALRPADLFGVLTLHARHHRRQLPAP